MIDFFRAIFFGQTLLLTPMPVDIQSNYDLILSAPISAVTEGAYIGIDIASGYPSKSDVFGALEAAKKEFPKGCVVAELSQSRGNRTLHMLYSGGFIGTKDGLRLMIEAAANSPIDVKFDKLHVTSCKVIAKARIYWKNTHDL